MHWVVSMSLDVDAWWYQSPRFLQGPYCGQLRFWNLHNLRLSAGNHGQKLGQVNITEWWYLFLVCLLKWRVPMLTWSHSSIWYRNFAYMVEQDVQCVGYSKLVINPSNIWVVKVHFYQPPFQLVCIFPTSNEIFLTPQDAWKTSSSPRLPKVATCLCLTSGIHQSSFPLHANLTTPLTLCHLVFLSYWEIQIMVWWGGKKVLSTVVVTCSGNNHNLSNFICIQPENQLTSFEVSTDFRL